MYQNQASKIGLLATLLPLTVFTKEIGMLEIGGIQFDILSYPYFAIVFALFALTGKLTFKTSELFVFLYLLAVGLTNVILFDLPITSFFKQFIPIVLIYYAAKNVLLSSDITAIFEKYVQFALWAAYIGYVQLLLKLVGINLLTPLTNFAIDSVALEPSHYVLIILPAVVYMIEKKNYSWKFYVLFASLILTFKVTALAALVVYYILRNFKRIKRQLFVGSILLALFVVIVQQVPEFADRVFGFIDFYHQGNLRTVENLTVFSFVSNLQAAWVNFLQTYGFGVGLGGHETMYFRNISSDDSFLSYYYGINAASAHSLSIRVLSEIGLPGVLFYLYLYVKTLKIDDKLMAALAWAGLSHFIVKSIKLGGYFDYGTIFFLLIILLAIEQSRRSAKEVSSNS